MKGDGLMDIIFNFFKSKRINYFVGLAFAILMIFLGIFYAVTYNAETYYNAIVWIIAIIGGLAYIGLSIFDITAPFAPILLGLGGLGAFTSHIRYCYMYFTNIFFNGVTLKAILVMNFTCTLAIVIPLITLIASIVLMYLKQTRKEIA